MNKGNEMSAKLRESSTHVAIYLIASFLLTFLSLIFILKTGFVGDCAYNSQIKGVVINEGVTIFHKFYYETKGWILGAGRFFPLHWYPYILYNYTQSEPLVKAIGLVVISSGVFFFGLFVRAITGSFKIGLIAIAAAPICFQIRAWHDPILSFTFLLPLLFLYLIVSLFLFQKYLDENKAKYLYWSAFFHLIGLLTYEAGYLFFPLFPLLALASQKTLIKALKKSLLPVFISFVVIGTSLLLKSKINPHFNNGYPGANLSMDYLAVLKTLMIQLVAGLPLSYKIFTRDVSWWGAFSNASWVATIISGGIFSYALTTMNVNVNHRLLIYLGGAIMFLSAFVIALSGHQQELIGVGLGYGYIPVYFQYFGFCLFGLGLIILIKKEMTSRLMRNWFNAVLIFAFILTGLLHSGQNKYIALRTNSFYYHPKVLLKNALSGDLSGIIDSGSIIVRTPRYPYDNPWFFSAVFGSPMKVFDANFFAECEKDLLVESLSSGMVKVTPADKPIWFLAYNASKYPHGYLYAGRLKHAFINADTKKTSAAVVDKLYFFTDKKLTEIKLDSNLPIDFMKVMSAQDHTYTDNGNLSQIQDRYSLGGVLFDWINIHPMDGDYKANVRWSSGVSEVNIFNTSSQKQTVAIHFMVSTGYQRKSEFKVLLDESLLSAVTVNNQPYNYSQEIDIPPMGKRILKFTSAEEVMPNSDPRKIVFGVFNFNYSINPGSGLRHE